MGLCELAPPAMAVVPRFTSSARSHGRMADVACLLRAHGPDDRLCHLGDAIISRHCTAARCRRLFFFFSFPPFSFAPHKGEKLKKWRPSAAIPLNVSALPRVNSSLGASGDSGGALAQWNYCRPSLSCLAASEHWAALGRSFRRLGWWGGQFFR